MPHGVIMVIVIDASHFAKSLGGVCFVVSTMIFAGDCGEDARSCDYLLGIRDY